MANDRPEEALDVMAKYHGEGDRNSPIVQLEYKEMLRKCLQSFAGQKLMETVDISKTGSDKRWWDYSELFNSKPVRYRTMLVVAMVHSNDSRTAPFHLNNTLAGIFWSVVWQRARILLLSTNPLVSYFVAVSFLPDRLREENLSQHMF